MGAKMKCENNSPVLLSSKHTRAFSRTRADEPFTLPSFSDVAPTDLLSFKLSGAGPKLENPSDMERLKKIMLEHESMFKEQLYELHRLYQVQRVLMEESKKGFANDPHSGSPSSNSSLIYNPDVHKLKGESRSGDAHDLTKTSVQQQFSFLPSRLDLNTDANKTHVSSGHMKRVAGASCHRPIIDLECPADESTELEREEKLVTMDMLFDGKLSGQDADMRVLMTGHNLEEGSGRIGTFQKSLMDCATIELPRHKEVPLFPLGPAMTHDFLSDKEHSSYSRPAAANLFGYHLTDEYNSRERVLPSLQRTQKERRKEWQFPVVEDNRQCLRVGESKLPHWLLQGSPPTSSAPTILPKNLTSQKNENLPFLVQKFGDRKQDSCTEKGTSAQDIWSPWPTSGTKLQFGESLLKVPLDKPSHWYFPSPTTGKDGQDYHSASQAADVNDSTSSLFRLWDQRGADVASSTSKGYPSFSGIDRQSPVREKPGAPTSTTFLPSLSIRGRTDAWPQQHVSSLVTPSTYVHGLPWWAPVSTSGNIKTDSCTRSTFDFGGSSFSGVMRAGIVSESEGLVPPRAAEAKLCPKRLNFGFMPKGCNLDLTLGLDLNANRNLGSSNGLESLSMHEDRGQAKDRADEGLKFVRNNFDLNIKSKQDLDICCTSDMLAGSKEEPKHVSKPGLPEPTGTVARTSDQWQTLTDRSSVNGIPRVSTTASISSPVHTFPFTICRESSPADCLKNPRIPGGIDVVGKGSDGSALMSCGSRGEGSDTISLTKARVHESISSVDGDCLARTLSKDSSEKCQVEACTMAGSQCQTGSGFFSKLLSSFHDVQTSFDFYVSKDHTVNGDVTDADAAEILLHMGLDIHIDSHTTADDQGRSLQWLAGLVETLPEGDNLENDPTDGASASLTVMETTPDSTHPFGETRADTGTVLDSFEHAVLTLKPVDPKTEKCIMRPVERCEPVEESPHPANLRRRSLRRVRSGKDFQKELLPSIASLSRQEINEDLQIIEGLVKSAADMMVKCSPLLKENVIMPWSMPRLLSTKASSGKAKGSKPCRARGQNGLLRMCSWGELGRRKRMRRQRSQRLFLPPGF